MPATATPNLADALTRTRTKPRDRSPSSMAIMTAFCDMRLALAALDVPQLPVTCRPDDLSGIGAHVLALAKIADAYMRVLGEELQRNSPAECAVDTYCFRDVFFGAVENNADYQARRAADILADVLAELARGGVG